jgi:hypothetical protein
MSFAMFRAAMAWVDHPVIAPAAAFQKINSLFGPMIAIPSRVPFAKSDAKASASP